MRAGLLTRFWGSLGMAVGVAALIGFFPFSLIWFIYLGLLLLGRVPGGRPPAWAAGEAVPWPTPGEKAAAELEAPDRGRDRRRRPTRSESRRPTQRRAARKRKQRDCPAASKRQAG